MPIPRKPKSMTELAARKQREAYIERRCKPVPIMAPALERAADELMALPSALDLGPDGEVVRTHSAPDQFAGVISTDNQIARMHIRDTSPKAQPASPKTPVSAAPTCCCNRASTPWKWGSTPPRALVPPTA